MAGNRGAPVWSTGLEGEGPADLPEPRHGKYNWTVIARRAKAVSPEWFKVFEHDKLSLVTQIRNGDVRALTKDKGFTVTTRNNKPVIVDGKSVKYCTLFVRYNPENDRSND